MNWQPISSAPKDGTRVLLTTSYPKARYPIIIGAWNAKFKEWQSSPGGWPMRPERWAPLPSVEVP